MQRRNLQHGETLGPFTIQECFRAVSDLKCYRASRSEDGSSVWLYALDLRQLPPDPERDQAFKERAQALQGIRHFTLPMLLEADARDGWQWAAFAPVPGISLRDQLGGHGPLDPTQGALLLHDIGSTLKALRLQGIHGMLDVSSIHLNANKRLRCLLDFGISKLFDIVPSPHFCRAPEQWNNPRHASESTDIYAAAVIAWEAIAGDEPGALSGGDPYREKRFRQRIPALRAVREDVHEALSNLIFEWTSHDESERPKTWISALILLGSVLYELNDAGSRHPTAELLSAEDSEPPTRPNSETQRRRALLPPPLEHADTLPAPLPNPRFPAFRPRLARPAISRKRARTYEPARLCCCVKLSKQSALRPSRSVPRLSCRQAFLSHRARFDHPQNKP